MFRTFIHKENDADLILPNLWLGNYKSALNSTFLRKHRIRYIVNVTTEIPCPNPHINYFNLRVERKFDNVNVNMTPIINQIVDFIDTGRHSGYGVLVHCKKGHHRSASIVLAYLIKYKGLSFDDGVEYIRTARPTALSRPASMVLCAYQYYLDLVDSSALDSKAQ